jgi:hypothetical protein
LNRPDHPRAGGCAVDATCRIARVVKNRDKTTKMPELCSSSHDQQEHGEIERVESPYDGESTNAAVRGSRIPAIAATVAPCRSRCPAPAGPGVARWLVVGAGCDGALAGLVASPHDCTPPWPRQAPARFVPVKAVPSLQVAVTVAVPCACAPPMGSISPAARTTDSRRFPIRRIPHPPCFNLWYA